MFINALIGFLIVALAIFLLVRAVNRIRRETPPEPAMTNEEKLLTEIRDLLQGGAAPSRPRVGTTGVV